MPVDLDATRTLLASVAGFTPGPWKSARPPIGPGLMVYGSGDGGNHYAYPVAAPLNALCEKQDAALIAAAPDLHRELTEAVGEIERLRAHNARMVAFLDTLTECMPGLGNGYALDAAIRKHAGWEPAGVGGAHKAGWVGRLAAGEVDDA